jgi:hypothetical protein
MLEQNISPRRSTENDLGTPLAVHKSFAEAPKKKGPPPIPGQPKTPSLVPEMAPVENKKTPPPLPAAVFEKKAAEAAPVADLLALQPGLDRGTFAALSENFPAAKMEPWKEVERKALVREKVFRPDRLQKREEMQQKLNASEEAFRAETAVLPVKAVAQRGMSAEERKADTRSPAQMLRDLGEQRAAALETINEFNRNEAAHLRALIDASQPDPFDDPEDYLNAKRGAGKLGEFVESLNWDYLGSFAKTGERLAGMRDEMQRMTDEYTKPMLSEQFGLEDKHEQNLLTSAVIANELVEDRNVGFCRETLGAPFLKRTNDDWAYQIIRGYGADQYDDALANAARDMIDREFHRLPDTDPRQILGKMAKAAREYVTNQAKLAQATDPAEKKERAVLSAERLRMLQENGLSIGVTKAVADALGDAEARLAAGEHEPAARALEALLGELRRESVDPDVTEKEREAAFAKLLTMQAAKNNTFLAAVRAKLARREASKQAPPQPAS